MAYEILPLRKALRVPDKTNDETMYSKDAFSENKD
jgi:hypothetical protein